MAIVAVGIDRAVNPRRTTGFCGLTGPRSTRPRPLGSDREILEATREAAPDVVSIDAPLSLPRGLRRLGARTAPPFRACDLALRARRIPFFPITLGPMRLLMARGIRLGRRLEADGFVVIESYPGGAQEFSEGPARRTASSD